MFPALCSHLPLTCGASSPICPVNNKNDQPKNERECSGRQGDEHQPAHHTKGIKQQRYNASMGRPMRLLKPVRVSVFESQVPTLLFARSLLLEILLSHHVQ